MAPKNTPAVVPIETIQAECRGKRCWHVAIGGFAAHTFSLHLGGKRAQKPPLRKLKNKTLPDEVRNFEEEYQFYVYCLWRLDDPAGSITSSDDAQESIWEGLKRLEGSVLEKVEIARPCWDVVLSFSTGEVLKVFCEYVPGNPSWDNNWDVVLPEIAYSFGPGAECESEKR